MSNAGSSKRLECDRIDAHVCMCDEVQHNFIDYGIVPLMAIDGDKSGIKTYSCQSFRQ